MPSKRKSSKSSVAREDVDDESTRTSQGSKSKKSHKFRLGALIPKRRFKSSKKEKAYRIKHPSLVSELTTPSIEENNMMENESLGDNNSMRDQSFADWSCQASEVMRDDESISLMSDMPDDETKVLSHIDDSQETDEKSFKSSGTPAKPSRSIHKLKLDIDWNRLQNEVSDAIAYSALDTSDEVTRSQCSSNGDGPFREKGIGLGNQIRTLDLDEKEDDDSVNKLYSIKTLKAIASVPAPAKKKENAKRASLEEMLAASLNRTKMTEPGFVRMTVLLISPAERKIELIRVKCHEDTTVQYIVDDLIPHFAVGDLFRNQRYRGLCRTQPCDSNFTNETISVEEFINAFPIEVYNIKSDTDVLIAIPEADETTNHLWTADECAKIATAIQKHEANTTRDIGVKTKVATDRRNKTVVQMISISKLFWQMVLGKIKLICLVVLAIISIAVFTQHFRLMRPLRPGDGMRIGELRARCGLLETIVPKDFLHRFCYQTSLEFTTNGVLIYREGFENEPMWEISGASRVELFSSDSDSLQSGAHELCVDEFGKLWLFDMPAKIKYYQRANKELLAPWPFSQLPPDL